MTGLQISDNKCPIDLGGGGATTWDGTLRRLCMPVCFTMRVWLSMNQSMRQNLKLECSRCAIISMFQEMLFCHGTLIADPGLPGSSLPPCTLITPHTTRSFTLSLTTAYGIMPHHDDSQLLLSVRARCDTHPSIQSGLVLRQ